MENKKSQKYVAQEILRQIIHFFQLLTFNYQGNNV